MSEAASRDIVTSIVLILVTMVWVSDFAYSVFTHVSMDPQIHVAFILIAGGAFTARGMKRDAAKNE